MFAILKRWFGKKHDSKKTADYPTLNLREGVSQAVRAEAPVFRGPKSISEEVISRVAKEIELEGLGAPRSEKTNEKGLGRV
jgi:hypothetical protein